MSVNVNRNVTDAFYRYKMPKLLAKVEGKGNGIKTVLVNMTDVSKALARPPTYATKYFGCELGAQTTLNVKDERFIVNGSHDCSKLQDILDGFIRKFVLCPECDNPETNLIVSQKKQTIAQRCIACGYTGQIDMRHKLTTYILKNPPEIQNDHGTSETPSKKDGKKGGKKAKGKQNGHDGNERTSPEVNAQEQSAAARTGGVVYAPPVNDDDVDEDDWGEDTSAEAMKQRLLELTDAAKSLAMNDDMEKTPQERVDLFYNFVKNKKNNGLSAGVDREILAEAERLDIKDKAPLILGEVLFSENMLSEIKDYRILFLRFTHENQKAQKYLLGAFEMLVGDVFKKVLMPKVPHILKLFYDMDIIDEEVILDWSKKVSKKYVPKAVCQEIHDKAAPFVKWLQEAEEDESDSEEDVEVVYSHTEKTGTQLVEQPKVAAAAEPEEDDDDFDIDDI